REQPGARQVPRWTMPALVVGVASLSLLTIVGGSEVKGKGTVPFDRSTVISTRSAGLGASAEDLAPRTPATLPSAPPPPDPVPAPPRPHPAHENPAASPPARQRRRAHMAAAEPPVAPAPPPKPSATPSPKPAPLVVNIGTRIAAILTEPVVTGAALAPA